jgi:hypothetical protein
VTPNFIFKQILFYRDTEICTHDFLISLYVFYMPLYKLFSTARSYSLGLIIFLHNRIYFTLTISHIHLQFCGPQVYNLHLYFLGSHLYKYKLFFIFYPQVFQIAYIVPTTRGHYPIIFNTTCFQLTFRDCCGIKLLLGHQYGFHYTVHQPLS